MRHEDERGRAKVAVVRASTRCSGSSARDRTGDLNGDQELVSTDRRGVRGAMHREDHGKPIGQGARKKMGRRHLMIIALRVIEVVCVIGIIALPVVMWWTF